MKPNATLNIKQHSTFEMLSGSKLIIEDGAVLRVKNSAFFFMHPNSEVIVEGDGEVIVEDGGYFFYDKDASIELKDPQTCFRIDGTWELGVAADFTFTGLGFVFLGTPATSQLILGGNNRITLNGSNANDKVLELGDHSFLYPDASFYTFHWLNIQNGQIVMGDNAGILLENTNFLTLKNLNIISKNPPNKSYGIASLGLKNHDIDNILMKYSKNGLTVHHFAGDSTLRVKNSNFYLNTSGIRNHWGAVHIDQSGFYDNTTGLNLIGLIHPSQFIQSHADTNTVGIHIQGGNADFFFDRGTANDNSIGVEASGDVTFRAHCGDVIDNTTYGFSMNQQAILDLSDFPAQKPTQLDAYNNPVTIQLDRSGVVRLFGGFNDLEPTNMSAPNVLKGTMLDSCRTWDASHNTWNGANQSPVSGTDYDVTSDIAGLSNCNIFFDDQSPLTSSYTCGQIPSGGGGVYDPDLVGPFYSCEACPDIIISISDDNDDTLAVHVAVRNATLLMRQYDHDIGSSTRSDINAVSQLLQILEYDYSSWPGQADEIQFLLDIAYENMKRAFASAVAHGEVTLKDEGDLDYLSNDVIDYLDAQLDSATYHHKIRYESDKGVLYRMLGYVSTAHDIFEGMEEYATGDDLDQVEKYTCRLQKEIDYLNDEISAKELIDGWDACDGSTERNGNPNFQTKEKIELPKAEIKAFPNPTTGNLTIELFQPTDDYVKLTARDMHGRLVKELLDLPYLPEGKYNIRVNMSDWANGLYVIQYESVVGTKSVKVVKK